MSLRTHSLRLGSFVFALLVARPALAQSAAAQGAPLAAEAKPSAQVHLDADRNVVLEARPESEEDDAWRFVCAAPCDRRVPLDLKYRITGSGMADSEPLHVSGAAGDHVTLLVHPESHTGRTVAGVLLIVASPIAALVGLGMVGGGIGDGTDSNNTEISAGFATIGVGAVSLVAGVLLLATGHTATSVTQTRTAPNAASASGDFNTGWRF